MKKLLLILLCLPIMTLSQKRIDKLGNDTISKIYQTQLLELECNICDSIILINPDKQKRGEWILDFRKTRNLDGEWENTKWMYTYGNTTEDTYDRNFVPDTLVACVWSETVESTKCCSKWAWDGLSWKKQNPATLKQAKSYIEFPNLQSKLKQSKRKNNENTLNKIELPIIEGAENKIYDFKTGKLYKNFNSIPVGTRYIYNNSINIKIAKDGYRFLKSIN